MHIAILAVLGVMAMGLIAAVVLLIVLLTKKKSKSAAPPPPAPFPTPVPHPDKTTFTGEYSVQISDIRHPKRKWKLTVTEEITIGRAPDCTLVLSDSRVSRRHCRISAGDKGLLVTNLSETNETRKNGLIISGTAPLNAGDVLKLGYEVLRIDFVKKMDGSGFVDVLPSDSMDEYSQQSPDDKTMNFF